MTKAELVVDDVVVEYNDGGQTLRPVDHLSFAAHDGELVVVMAPSGGGKTTLLSVLAGLLTPVSGRVMFAGSDVTGRSRAQLRQYRREVAGMIFQSYNLIPSLTALENVMAPLLLTGVPTRRARTLALAALDQVDLVDRARHRPGKLSGGQQQRVAFARAVVRNPQLLIADEPTAHLDADHTGAVLDLLRATARPGRLVVVASHDDRFLDIADAVIRPSGAGRTVPQLPAEAS